MASVWVTVRAADGATWDVEVAGPTVTIGRHPDSDLVIADPKVSARHAELAVADDGTLTVRDVGSTNGTALNGRPVSGLVTVRPGDQLEVGDTRVTVGAPDGPVRAAAVSAATVIVADRDAPPPPPPLGAPPRRPIGASTLQRLVGRRTRGAMALAGASLAVTVAVLALVLTGVIGGGDGDPSAAEIVDMVRESTVLVLVDVGDGPEAAGTGWVLDAAEGLIVTNNHVVNGGSRFLVSVGEDRRPARLVGAAPCDDLAVLQVTERSRLRTLRLGSQAGVRQGDPVVAVGFPVNASSRDELTATTGVVSVARTSFEGEGEAASLVNAIQTDAAINPGNSGGPLVDREGRLIGVNTAGLTGELQNVNYAIGVDRVQEVTAELRQGRSLGWTGMGLAFPADPRQLTSVRLPAQPGIVVTGAVPGTPAAEAGLEDALALLVAVDGRPLTADLTSYCEAAGDRRSGDSAEFSFIAPGSTRPVPVRIGFA
jgi:S1-C subfamily serine protease